MLKIPKSERAKCTGIHAHRAPVEPYGLFDWYYDRPFDNGFGERVGWMAIAQWDGTTFSQRRKFVEGLRYVRNYDITQYHIFKKLGFVFVCAHHKRSEHYSAHESSAAFSAWLRCQGLKHNIRPMDAELYKWFCFNDRVIR